MEKKGIGCPVGFVQQIHQQTVCLWVCAHTAGLPGRVYEGDFLICQTLWAAAFAFVDGPMFDGQGARNSSQCVHFAVKGARVQKWLAQ